MPSAMPRAWGGQLKQEVPEQQAEAVEGNRELGHFCFCNLKCTHSSRKAQSPPPHAQAEKQALYLMEIKRQFRRATSIICLGFADCEKAMQHQAPFLPPLRSGANMVASDHISSQLLGKQESVAYKCKPQFITINH